MVQLIERQVAEDNWKLDGKEFNHHTADHEQVVYLTNTKAIGVGNTSFSTISFHVDLWQETLQFFMQLHNFLGGLKAP